MLELLLFVLYTRDMFNVVGNSTFNYADVSALYKINFNPVRYVKGYESMSMLWLCRVAEQSNI